MQLGNEKGICFSLKLKELKKNYLYYIIVSIMYINSVKYCYFNVFINIYLQILYQSGIFMLLSSICSSIILPSAVSSSSISSSAIPMTMSTGLPQYSALVIAGLFIIYSLREVLSSSEIWNKCLDDSFKLAIIPLILCFVMVVTYKVTEII